MQSCERLFEVYKTRFPEIVKFSALPYEYDLNKYDMSINDTVFDSPSLVYANFRSG